MKPVDIKAILSESRLPTITCKNGHTYRVPYRFYNRAIKKPRAFVCPTCLVSFNIKKQEKNLND